MTIEIRGSRFERSARFLCAPVLTGAALATAVAMGCVSPVGAEGEAEESVDSQSAPIVDGVAESGYPEVVYLYNLAGAACTATIVSPRLVLTAKHCVQDVRGAPRAAPASNFRILVGSSSESATNQYFVEEVRPAPGDWNLRDASDVAVLILASPAIETPREMAFDSVISLVSGEFTAVGFGQTPSGGSGQKFSTTKRVSGIQRGFVFVEPSVCSGDSGGPLIGPDGRVYGVASFIYSETGSEPRCGTAPGAYNGLFEWREFLEEAIEDSGACVPSEELCNRLDDNCDGQVDEGCTPLGGACAASDECVGERCAEVTPGGGNVCTLACNPMNPAIGCPEGFYCSAPGIGACEGLCAAGSVGEGLVGAACSTNTECLTGLCADPGDGQQRCLPPCRGDLGDCLAGEVCLALPGTCGACIEQEIYQGRHGIGEPCGTIDHCLTGLCFHEEGVSYCSRACEGDEACGEGFHCRDAVCIRGPREGIGGGCITNEDCGSGFCATEGENRWCTTFCATNTDCPSGFVCTVVTDEASVCEPELGLIGEACMDNASCISGLCATGTRHGSVCTEMCGPGNACSPGFECERLDGGLLALCLAPQDAGGGCSTGGENAPLAAFAALGLFLLRPRRRRAIR